MAKINVDLTTLANYSSLAEGTYTVSVEAVGADYANSLKSTGVSFTKQSPTTYEQTGSTVRITNANYKQNGGTLRLL